jgi:hypothetical protein
MRFVKGQGIITMPEIKYAVTHPGPAHRDDTLAIALALSLEGDIPVFRRLPTEEELSSPCVLVLDTGERYEPELNNFDHHQFDEDAEEPNCAMSLYLKSRGLEEIFDLQRWYLPTILLDDRGPYATAKILNINRFPYELVDPIGTAIVNLFGSYFGQVLPETLVILRTVGEQILSATKKFADQIFHLERVCEVIQIDGYKVLVLRTSDITASQEFRNRSHPDAIASISWDNRGSGWSMYRFSQHCPVNFGKLTGNPEVLFTHRDGSLAKTQRRLPIEEVLDLVSQSLERPAA